MQGHAREQKVRGRETEAESGGCRREAGGRWRHDQREKGGEHVCI